MLKRGSVREVQRIADYNTISGKIQLKASNFCFVHHIFDRLLKIPCFIRVVFRRQSEARRHLLIERRRRIRRGRI